MASCSCRSTAAAAPSTSPTTFVAAHPHAVEVHRGEAADEVGGVERLDRDARSSRRRDEELGEATVIGPPPVRPVTSSSSACAAASTGVADAVEHEVVAVTRRGDRDRHAVSSQPPPGPAMHHAADDLAGDDPGQHPGPQLGRTTVGDGGRDDVGGHERARRHQPAHLLGDDRPGRARPHPLRLPPPSSSGTRSDVHPSSAPRAHHARSKPSAVVGERPHGGQRRLLFQELRASSPGRTAGRRSSARFIAAERR